MTTLVLASSNPGKLQEMKEYFANVKWQLQLKPQDLEVEETGQTFLENASLKASLVALALNQYTIADDSGLSVRALGGAPGIYSARYAPTDALCIEKLLKELENSSDRAAEFVCALAVSDPNGQIILTSQGKCQGIILEKPQGERGFGYDPIFYLPEYGETFAQMDPDLKSRLSHRGVAFASLLPALIELEKSV
jgi:XTP/dITP diphosphohydrolase